MAKLKMRDIMNLKYVGEPSVEQIIAGLQYAKTVKALNSNKDLMSIIDVVIIALESYNAVIQIYEGILEIMPLIERATKIAGAYTNPALLSEIAQDILVETNAIIVDEVENAKTQAVNFILDYEIEI